MPGFLRYNTATAVVIGPFFDDVDFKTLETALGLAASDVTLSKNGAAYAAKNETTVPGTYSNGMYVVSLNATDTNTPGILAVLVNKAGALVVWDSFNVIPQHVYDSLIIYGGVTLASNVIEWAYSPVATPDTAGYPKVTVKDGTGAGELQTDAGVVQSNVVQTNFEPIAYTDASGFRFQRVFSQDHTGADLATAAQIAALENVSAAEVKTQVVDALTVDTYAEPGQTAPPATTTILGRLQWIYKAWRNKVDQSGSQYKLYNDAGDTVDNKSALTDDSTVYQKGKVGSGP